MEKGKCSAKIWMVYALYAIDTLTYQFCDNVLTLIRLQIRYTFISTIPNTETGCGSRSFFFTDWNLKFLSPQRGRNLEG